MEDNISLFAQFWEFPPFSLDQSEKKSFLLSRLQGLTMHHYSNCEVYKKIVDRVFGGLPKSRLEDAIDLPFLPVSLFKSQELRSVPSAEIIKVLTSSGTTGQVVSKVYLDRDTASAQQRALIKITQHFMGTRRLPMVVVDTPSVIRNGDTHSARAAGVLGMMQFGQHPFYALHEDMSLDVDGLMQYVARTQGGPILFFGFTYIVWQYFIVPLEKAGIKMNAHGFLIHSGGWKKMQDLAVSTAVFRQHAKLIIGIEQCINFYGLVEQVGSVFYENPLFYMHAPIYADVIIRDPVSLRPVREGQAGLIQLVSMLPYSYPGHSILTEDLGVIRGCDHPTMMMRGRYFEILGRMPESDLRGCSDTFESIVRA